MNKTRGKDMAITSKQTELALVRVLLVSLIDYRTLKIILESLLPVEVISKLVHCPKYKKLVLVKTNHRFFISQLDLCDFHEIVLPMVQYSAQQRNGLFLV